MTAADPSPPTLLAPASRTRVEALRIAHELFPRHTERAIREVADWILEGETSPREDREHLAEIVRAGVALVDVHDTYAPLDDQRLTRARNELITAVRQWRDER